MRFEFRLTDAAIGNTPAARNREAVRMACIADSVRHLGHQVFVSGKPACMTSDRWWSFTHLEGYPGTKRVDALVVPAEQLVRRGSQGRPQGDYAALVGFKTSVSVEYDREMLGSMGERAREYIRSNYGIEDTARSYGDFAVSLLTGGGLIVERPDREAPGKQARESLMGTLTGKLAGMGIGKDTAGVSEGLSRAVDGVIGPAGD